MSGLNFKYLINIVSSKIDATVRLLGKPETTRPIIVLEFAEGGELFDYIAKEGKFKPEICRSLFRMLIEAIDYMNAKGVSHRDLKPENILFDKNYYLKVSDFGLSTETEGHEGDGFLYTRLGTEGYKPPEMESGKYLGLQADLFAAGVILFVMYTGTPPFLSTKNTDKIYKLIRDRNFAKFWSLHEKKKPVGFYPDSLKRLLSAFFSAEVERRPTLETLRDDEWMNADQALQDDIYQDLRAKYLRMIEGDENKQKIEQAKVEMLQSSMMEEEDKYCPHRDSPSEFLSMVIKYQDIETGDLPVSEKEQLIGISKSPAFLISWLGEWINEAAKSGKTFLNDYPCEVNAQKYDISFDEEKNQLNLTFIYTVDEDIETLIISGDLVCIKGDKIAVSWNKEQGNEFWLTSIIGELNRELKAIA